MNRWKEVTPAMMSDEEELDDVYVRHRPAYRSALFNSFIDKLDERENHLNPSRPRHKRQLGEVVDVPIPNEAKKWMIDERFVEAEADIQETANSRGKDMNTQDNSDKDNNDTDNESNFSFNDDCLDDY